MGECILENFARGLGRYLSSPQFWGDVFKAVITTTAVILVNQALQPKAK